MVASSPRRIKRANFWAGILLLGIAAVTASGCSVGSSSSGTPQTGTVTGAVLVSATDAPPAVASTITAGGQTVQAAANDGTFTLTNVPVGTTTLTVEAAGQKKLTLPIALAANQTDALGAVFLSATGYTASLTGTVQTINSGVTAPVANASVMIGNVTAKTGANGGFTLNGLPIGLGAGIYSDTVYGNVVAAGFLSRPITANNLTTPLVDGPNALQPIFLAASTSTVPGQPYNISGVVTVGGKPGTGVTLSLSSGGAVVGPVTLDSTGSYTIWTVPGTYTLTATYQGQPKQQTINLLRADRPVVVPTIAF